MTSGGDLSMELRHELTVSEASVPVDPDGGSRAARRLVVVAVLLLVQAGIVWLFVPMWWWHVGNILEAPGVETVLVRALSAVLVVGILTVEIVMLARRRREPLPVTWGATGALVFTMMLESMGSF
ncbi:hypothetical protein ACQFYA_18370 [Promicromonospora sp. Marseille-Q5078]